MEKISVSVRVRPLNKLEIAKGSPWTVDAKSLHLCNERGQLIAGQAYTFDHVFNTGVHTKEIYEAVTEDIIKSTVHGFNGTVFAYGQTSSGKTHTMRGTGNEPGIIPLAIQDVFRSIEKAHDREFLLRVSYLEIYNEEINDLLNPQNRKLPVHENLERGVFVAGLAEEIVVSPEHVLGLMATGEAHRHIGETNMNQASSRSHTIFRMVIESREKLADDDSSIEEHGCDAVRVSSLTLVDLAGSERVAKTGAEGARMKEGTHINKSLMTLGTVINKLAEGVERNGGHIPYRDSKLTRILQPALGGNAKTAIICNVTPSVIHVEETRGTLQFAGRAKRIENCAQINEIVTEAALLKRQQREIEELRRKLQGNNSEIMEGEIAKMRNAMLAIELEKERLAAELEERRAEEQQRKEETEKRIREQQQKIDSLSHMVINSAVDESHEKKARKGNRRATWVPRIQPSVFSDLGSDRPPLREVPQGLLGSGLPPPAKMSRSRDLPPAFERLEEEPFGPSMGRPFRISEESSLSDLGEESPGAGQRSSENRLASERVSVDSTETTVEQQLIDLQQKYKELEERTQNAQAPPTSHVPPSGSISHLGAILEDDEVLPTSTGDRRGRSLGGAEGHASVKALQTRLRELELEKVFMQRELDDLMEQTKMRASISKDELNAVYAELDEARHAFAASPRDKTAQTVALQEQLSEALRERDAAFEALQRGEERAVKSARAQIQGLEGRLAEALREKETSRQNETSSDEQVHGLERRLTEALLQLEKKTQDFAKREEELSALRSQCEKLSGEVQTETGKREAAEACANEVAKLAQERQVEIAGLEERLKSTGHETCTEQAGKLERDAEIDKELAAKTDQLAKVKAALVKERRDLADVQDQQQSLLAEDITAAAGRESASEALLAEARAKIMELEGDLEEAVRVLEEDDVRRAEQQSLLTKAEEELAEARGQLAERGDVGHDIQGLTAQLKLLEEELAVAKEELAQKDVETQSLEHRLASAEVARKQLDEELEALKQESKSGALEGQQSESVGTEQLDLESRVAALAGELKEALGKADDAREEVDSFKKKTAVLDCEQSALEEQVRELEETRTQLGSMQDLLASEMHLRESAENALADMKLGAQNEDGRLQAANEERKSLLKTIAAMESERQKSEERLRSLVEEKDGVIRVSEEANQNLEHLKEVCKSLENQRNALQAALEECTRLARCSEVEKDEATDKLKEELQQLQEKLEEASAAKTEVELKVAELMEERKDLEDALKQEERSKENLAEQLSEAGAQLQTMRAEHSSLEEARANLESTVSALEVRIASLEADSEEAQAALQDSTAECARLFETVAQLQQSNAGLTASLAAAESRAFEAQGAVEEQKQQLVALCDEKEACLAKLLEKSKELEATRIGASEKVTELESQLETQRSVASEAFKELEAAKQSQHKEVSMLRTDLAALRKELVHAKSEPAALTKQRDGLQKELEKLRAKLKDTEAKLKTAVQDKSQLQAEKCAQERDLKRLRGQANEINNQSSKRESMAVKQRESLAVGLKIKSTELSSVQAALQNKGLELEKTVCDLQMLQNSYKFLEGTVSELESSRDSLTQRIVEVEACLAGVSSERDKLSADSESRAIELARAREEAEKVAQELAALVAEHSALKEQLQAAEAEGKRAAKLAEELEKLKAEHAQVMEQMTESHFQFEEDRASWEAKEAQAAKEKAEWEQQLAELTSLRSELETKVAGLDQQLAELKRQANEADAVKMSLLDQVAALEQQTEKERKAFVEERDHDLGRLKDEIEALKLQCEEMEHQLTLADSSLEESRQASAQAEAAASGREERLQEMLQQSMTEIAESRKALAAKDEQLLQLQAASLKLETALDGANGKVQLMEDRVATSEQQVEKMREQVERIKESKAELEEAAAKERNEAQRKIDAAEKAWRDDIEDRSLKMDQLQTSLAAANAKIQDLGAQVNELRARLEIEEERRKEAERVAEGSEDGQIRASQLEAEVERLLAQCQELKEEVACATAQNAPSEQAAELDGKLLEMTEQNRLLQNKLRKAEETVERLKSWKEEVRRQREKDAKTKAEVERLQAELDKREAVRMQLAAELAAANAQAAKAQPRQPASVSARASVEVQFEVKARAMLEERRDLKEKCRHLETRLTELRRLVERNGGKVADFDKHAAFRELEYKAASGKNAIEKLKAQVAQLEAQLTKAQTDKGNLKDKLQEVTFKNCALLRSESLHQLNEASPAKAAPQDGFSMRPPLAEKNKGLVASSIHGSPLFKKPSSASSSVSTRLLPSPLSRQALQRDKENKDREAASH